MARADREPVRDTDDDGFDAGWGAGAGAYARLRGLGADEPAPGGFFDRDDDAFPPLYAEEARSTGRRGAGRTAPQEPGSAGRRAAREPAAPEPAAAEPATPETGGPIARRSAGRFAPEASSRPGDAGAGLPDRRWADTSRADTGRADTGRTDTGRADTGGAGIGRPEAERAADADRGFRRTTAETSEIQAVGDWTAEGEAPPQPEAGQDPEAGREPGVPGDDVDQPAGRHGRRRRSAGRNVPVSIAVGLALAGTVLGVLFYAKDPWFLAVLVVASCVGIWELVRAVRPTGANPPMIPLMVGGTVMLGLAWFRGLEALSLGLLITVLAVFVWRLADGPAGYQRDIGASALIMVYVPFLLGFAVPLATPDDGQWRILATLAAVVLSDTGGFVAGVLFGKHPMAPTISPKKSWEGFAGSLVGAAAGSAIVLWVTLDVAPWWGAVFGALVALACVVGDLAESLLKRDLGIKDMSNLLPGHGGLMDRLDSILFALPVAYLLLSVLAPVS